MNKRLLPLPLVAALALTGAGCQLPPFLSFLQKQETTPVTSTTTAQAPAGNVADSGVMKLAGSQGSFSIALEVTRLPWSVNGTFTYTSNGKTESGVFFDNGSSATSSTVLLSTHTDIELGNLQLIWPTDNSNTVQATWTPKGSANALNLALTTQPTAHAFRIEKASVSHKDAKTGDEICHFQSGYPLLEDGERNARAINMLIEGTIAGSPATSTSIAPIEQRASEYVANCIGEIQDILSSDGPDDRSAISYSSDSSAALSLNSPNLISIRFDGYDYTGGAHGNPFLAGLNINVETGKALTLKDLFKSDQLQNVIAKERRILLSDEQGGYLYEETNAEYEKYLKLPLQPAAKQEELYGNDSNFYLTDSGIVLYHTAYEIAAYAAGQFETFIPYSDLKDMIRTDGPLAPFVK